MAISNHVLLFSSVERRNQCLNVTDPFPHIFNDKISVNGLIRSEPRPPNTGDDYIHIILGLSLLRVDVIGFII